MERNWNSLWMEDMLDGSLCVAQALIESLMSFSFDSWLIRSYFNVFLENNIKTSQKRLSAVHISSVHLCQSLLSQTALMFHPPPYVRSVCFWFREEMNVSIRWSHKCWSFKEWLFVNELNVLHYQIHGRACIVHASLSDSHCFPSPNLFHVVGVINTWGSAIFSCIVMEWDRNVWAFLLSKHCLLLWLVCFTLFYYPTFPVVPVKILSASFYHQMYYSIMQKMSISSVLFYERI